MTVRHTPGAGQAELLVGGLLVAITGLAALARRLSIPYPAVLVTTGAVAIVAFRVAVTAVVTGTFSLGPATLALVGDRRRRIAIGLPVGWQAVQVVLGRSVTRYWSSGVRGRSRTRP
jgi:hypothetical protein